MTKELSQLSYSQETGSQMPCNIPNLLFSPRHAKVGTYGLTTKYIHNTSQEKPGWLSKVENNEQRKKPLKSLLSHQGKKPIGASQGSIKYQNNL